MILGKAIKYRYFPKIRQINALKETLTEAVGRQISGWINHTYRPGKRTPVLTIARNTPFTICIEITREFPCQKILLSMAIPYLHWKCKDSQKAR
jgi:hypothetical protein